MDNTRHRAITPPPVTSDSGTISKNKKIKHRKRPWSAVEDQMLTRLVGEFNRQPNAHQPATQTKKWATIASKIPGRVGKQCRERWLTYLDPNVRQHDQFLNFAPECCGSTHADPTLPT